MKNLYEAERFYIGGRWVQPHGSERLQIISPSTGEIIGSVPAGTAKDIDDAVTAARHAFDASSWPTLTPMERAQYLRRAAALFAEQREEFADVQAEESGIPITAARG